MAKEAIELLAGSVERALRLFVEVPGEQRPTELINLVEHESAGIHLGCSRVLVAHFNEMSAKHPEVIAMPIQNLAAVIAVQQMQ